MGTGRPRDTTGGSISSRGLARADYLPLRGAHLAAVGAALQDHMGRLDWSREQIEDHQTHRLRSLLAYARERSPFHARRLRGLDPAAATVADLAALDPMSKRDAQEQWDFIMTAPGLDRSGAEQILAQQRWFSYTPGRSASFQLRWIQRSPRHLRLGLVLLCHRRLSGMADAGQSRKPQSLRRSGAIGGVGRRSTAAREHPLVRRADHRGHADRRDRSRRALR